MAHNTETIKLLKKLGLEYGTVDSETRQIYLNFLYLNSHPINRPAAAINAELKQMLIMEEQAKQQAAEFLASHGLTATEFVRSWNKYFMCMELKCKINGSPIVTEVNQYLTYEAREIQIRVMHTSSNNNFNPADVRKMFDIKKRAALALNPNINTTFDDLELLLDNPDKKSKSIIGNFGIPTLATTIASVVEIERKLLCRLAVELIRYEYQAFDYNPSQDLIEHKIMAIINTEKAMISRFNRRAIKIVAYPQETREREKYTQWMLTTNIPKSDISSDDRGLEVHRVPNAWSVTQYACKIKDDTLLSVAKHADVYRSASVAQLHEGKIHRGAVSDEYKNLCNLIIQTARDELIERINNGEKIEWTEDFLIKTAYITLLTPLLDKDTSSKSVIVRKAGGKLKETLITGNEDEQLHSLRIALKIIKDNSLTFTPLDTEYIISHIRPEIKAPADFKSKISKIVIKHQFFYSNFTVNTLKGFDLGKVKDCVKNNESHNSEGLAFLEQHLHSFFADKHIDFYALINHGSGDKKEWPEIKRTLSQLLIGHMDDDAHKILNLYIQLGDYFESQKDRNFNFSNVVSNILSKPAGNSTIVESYFAAMIEQQIAALLGFNIRTTCKSGKDRTGLFLAILEASAGPPEKFRINLCRALKYSDVKELIEQNRPGCRGIQVDSDVMDGLRQYFGVPLEGPPGEVKRLLELWESRSVGSIPKKVYKNIHYAVAEHVKHNPTTPGGLPKIISPPASNPNLGKKPIVPPRTYLREKKPEAPFLPAREEAKVKQAPACPPPRPRSKHKPVEKALIAAYLKETQFPAKPLVKPADPDNMDFAAKRAFWDNQGKSEKDNDPTKRRG